MEDISRRNFLQKGALAAAAVTVAGMAGVAAQTIGGINNNKSENESPLPVPKIIGRGTEMKIIQFSDTHLRGDTLLSFGKCDTVATVKKAMEFFMKMPEHELPDLFVCTGDLADHGNIPAYKKCKEYFAQLPRPVYCLPGNHDNRKDMFNIMGREFCPIEKGMEPYFCYTIEDKPIRIICVDTIVEGKHWGGITDKVAKWLLAKLDEQPDRLTIIFTHHPPFDTGMTYMDEGFENLEVLGSILTKHKDHIRLCCGHVHRNVMSRWRGVDVTITSSICLQMELDLRDQGGDRFFLGDPGYMVHHLYHNVINSHYCIIPTQATYAGPYPFKYLESDLKKG